MKTCVETITPEMAEGYLKRNIVNRKVSTITVNKYADDMRSGAWQLNGEAIAFNHSGKLIDGQHRLLAIIKCGIPCKTLVIRDVDDSVSVFNLARSRNQLDSIIMDGFDKDIANTTTVAMAKLHYYMHAKASTVSTSALKRFFDKYRDTLSVLSPIRKMGHGNGITIKMPRLCLP